MTGLHEEAERRGTELERAVASIHEQRRHIEWLRGVADQHLQQLENTQKTAAELEEQRRALELERNQLRRENLALTHTLRRFEQETLSAFLRRRWRNRK
jgi:hypothetical protein